MKLEGRILDTNAVSYIMNGHTNAQAYRPHLEGRELSISFMSVAELCEGAYRRGWDARRVRRFEEELGKYIVIPNSAVLCQIWGQVRAQRRQQPIAVDDAWIAATALGLDCPLVTHNPGDIHGIAGLKIITECVA
ncbi:type II toxin-antitoxin system VapC family toxin [Candidatus Sumerlaeota bacterium]|nr:type II toxin-antitoxin system VapC family toxin [Candidatus Sumerlaeota bacterium]